MDELPTFQRDGVTVTLTVREEQEECTVTNGELADLTDLSAVLSALPVNDLFVLLDPFIAARGKRELADSQSRIAALEKELAEERRAHSETKSELAGWRAACLSARGDV